MSPLPLQGIGQLFYSSQFKWQTFYDVFVRITRITGISKNHSLKLTMKDFLIHSLLLQHNSI